jgi:hypothetical protein
MALSRRGVRSNALVGIAMLLLLGMFVFYGPGVLSDVFPTIYSGVPCAWLRTADNRANHQSLVGRGTPDPISLSVQMTPLPATGEGVWFVNIIVFNNSVGTVPIVYDPNAVIVGDNGTSGLGLIFTPTTSLTTGFNRPQDYGANIPEQYVRLLGPKQRCVHTVEFAAGNVQIDPTVSSGTAQVRAYYRNNNAGTVTQPPGVVATPIYNDMGLWTGVVESGNAIITRSP